MQRIARGFGVVVALAVGTASAQTTAEDMVKAVDQMTPDQAYEFSNTLEAKLWKPVPKGFFSRLAVTYGVSSWSLDDADLGGLTPSVNTLDVDAAGGTELGLLWEVLTPGLRLGARFSGFEASDSDLTGGGYSRIALTGGTASLAANYQFVQSAKWLWWVEGSVGLGGLAVETVDTPQGVPTTLRELDGDFAVAELRAGVAWRFNPVLSLLASAGYRFAEQCTLDEGGRSSGYAVDASGFGAQLGLGVNF